MRAKHVTTPNDCVEVDESNQAIWLNWCRLCAKQEENDEENSLIFVKNEFGKLDSELATSIGKYFWVNIKADDKISRNLCVECKQLIEELINFTDRVNKVQTMFCLLENIKPTSAEQAIKLRSQCGLVDEGWEHIIKSEVEKTRKPLLTDRQVQTELIIMSKTEGDIKTPNVSSLEAKGRERSSMEALQKTDHSEKYECRPEIEDEHTYEYVMHSDNDNDIELIESAELITEQTNKESIVRGDDSDDDEDLDEEEVNDSDLFKELKLKLEDEEDQKIQSFKICCEQEEVEFEYQGSTHPQQDVRELDESMEILEEDEDEEDYINSGEIYPKTDSMLLLKGKRGRPFASKKSISDPSFYRFECKECKRRYKNPNLYRKHMIIQHDIVENVPDVTCSICNKVCFTVSRLKLHMRHHLPDEEKLNVPCPYCDRKFSQVGAMRQHVNGIHHQMKPYICDQCGRACKTMAALNEHQLVHTTECPFECEVCHKRFKNKARLKSHLDTHTKSVYKCPDCDLELNTKRTLLQHRLVHSDVKRFKCEFCEAAFKRSKALKNHLILHTGLRPYKCNFCDRAFSNGSNCRAHKKRTHPKELAEEEANGKVSEPVPIPRLEELKSAKGVVVQPRKIKRHPGGLPDRLCKLLLSAEKSKKQNPDDSDEPYMENSDNYSDFHYEIAESEVERFADNPSEECEQTVIYEIIDEI